MFDITRTGIQRTSAVEPHPQSKSRRRRNVILLGVGGATISIAAGLFLLPRAVAHKVDKSIAVLPFENLRRSGQRVFRRRSSGRRAYELVQDRRPEGDFSHLGDAIPGP